MKKHNFNAGPSILPQEVIENTAKAVLDFQGEGLSILEISHRAKYFQPVVDEAEALMRELLGIPENYSVIFLGGGASLQFCMLPFNLLEKKAAYLNTGVWAKKAMKEAKGFGEVVEVIMFLLAIGVIALCALSVISLLSGKDFRSSIVGKIVSPVVVGKDAAKVNSICPNCGKVIKGEFCANCGTKKQN